MKRYSLSDHSSCLLSPKVSLKPTIVVFRQKLGHPSTTLAYQASRIFLHVRCASASSTIDCIERRAQACPRHWKFALYRMDNQLRPYGRTIADDDENSTIVHCRMQLYMQRYVCSTLTSSPFFMLGSRSQVRDSLAFPLSSTRTSTRRESARGCSYSGAPVPSCPFDSRAGSPWWYSRFCQPLPW